MLKFSWITAVHLYWKKERQLTTCLSDMESGKEMRRCNGRVKMLQTDRSGFQMTGGYCVGFGSHNKNFIPAFLPHSS
jgi:hypothetical protein